MPEVSAVALVPGPLAVVVLVDIEEVATPPHGQYQLGQFGQHPRVHVGGCWLLPPHWL